MTQSQPRTCVGRSCDLQPLATVCQRYDERCRSASSAPLGATDLQALEDELWELSRTICAEVDAVAAQAQPEEREAFRATVFADRVLRWHRASPALARLWDKPAGYSGDYQT